jgi:GR25 family glycosyltransferase involved in LPS biosynthesis
MKNLNVYVIHCKNIQNRALNIDNLILKFKQLDSSYNVNFKIIEDYPVSELDNEKLSNLVKLEKIEDVKYEKYNNFLRNLTPQSISKSLKHYKCYQEIKKNDDSDFNLILEDDVSLEDTNFETNFNSIIKQLDTFDICMMGIPSSVENIEQNVFKVIDTKKIYNTLPGCDSYLISKKCAKTLANNFIPIRFELNVQLSFIAEMNNVSIQQASPNLFIELSKVGKFKSTTNINNVPIYNIKYKEMSNLIVKPALDSEDIIKLKGLWDDEFLKENPDYLYLKALYLFKQEKYIESKQHFDAVYMKFKEVGLPLNKDSNFMANYTEIFKFVQQ